MDNLEPNFDLAINLDILTQMNMDISQLGDVTDSDLMGIYDNVMTNNTDTKSDHFGGVLSEKKLKDNINNAVPVKTKSHCKKLVPLTLS